MNVDLKIISQKIDYSDKSDRISLKSLIEFKGTIKEYIEKYPQNSLYFYKLSKEFDDFFTQELFDSVSKEYPYLALEFANDSKFMNKELFIQLCMLHNSSAICKCHSNKYMDKELFDFLCKKEPYFALVSGLNSIYMDNELFLELIILEPFSAYLFAINSKFMTNENYSLVLKLMSNTNS